jgi:D-aminopeptidase
MRVRDFGVTPGRLPTGDLNAITDVAGVRVGHTTRIEGEGRLIPGAGPIRTGVTAILPHAGSLYQSKVAAGVYAVNGFGKAAGFEQIRARGTLETPILLTNTLNVGRAADALISYMIRQHPEIGITTGTVNPVVAECNDGFLNDLQGRHIHEAHVWAAIDGAVGGAVAEGNVGGGAGTACFQFKGGIGTSSRRVMDGRYTIGALVQTNYGGRAELMFLGVPLGAHLLEEYLPQPGQGSIIMVLATDAPLDSRQLSRLAARAGLGLARTGTTSHDGSGDFVIAFSTTNRYPHQPDDPVDTAARFNDAHPALNECFLAAVEATEEAILNALVAAETMTGRDGNTLYALPHDALRRWLAHYRRI